MSRESMKTIRERRREAGLAQMNVWIAEVDREAFLKAVAPFKQRARDLEATDRGSPVHLLRFASEKPSAELRNRMKAAGWSYDRETDLWAVLVTNGTRAVYDDWVAFLVKNHRATIERSP